MKANVISNNEVQRIGITMRSPKMRWEVQSGQTNRVSISNDENCDTKNETKQTPKGQPSTRFEFEVVRIREQLRFYLNKQRRVKAGYRMSVNYADYGLRKMIRDQPKLLHSRFP